VPPPAYPQPAGELESVSHFLGMLLVDRPLPLLRCCVSQPRRRESLEHSCLYENTFGYELSTLGRLPRITGMEKRHGTGIGRARLWRLARLSSACLCETIMADDMYVLTKTLDTQAWRSMVSFSLRGGPSCFPRSIYDSPVAIDEQNFYTQHARVPSGPSGTSCCTNSTLSQLHRHYLGPCSSLFFFPLGRHSENIVVGRVRCAEDKPVKALSREALSQPWKCAASVTARLVLGSRCSQSK